jgi:hypothetical protein
VRVLYTHHEALTFSDYTDLETGGTLHAVPGRVYDITPASGRVVPGFPTPWFDFADEETRAAQKGAAAEQLAAESAASEGAGDGEGPAPDGGEPQQQEGGEPQQF